jgi:hypothetical protein
MDQFETALRALEHLVVERLEALITLREAELKAHEFSAGHAETSGVDREYVQIKLFVARQNLRLAREQLQTELRAQQSRRTDAAAARYFIAREHTAAKPHNHPSVFERNRDSYD